MADPEIPFWVKLVRDDIASLRAENNSRFDKLVSQEAFEAERRRTEERFADLGHDVVQNQVAALTAVRESAADWKADLDLVQARTRSIWSGIRWAIGTLIAVAGVVVATFAIGR